MSNIKLGTLSKIEYQSLPEFIDLINRNFAVIQNSPMFRGIPGDEGQPGKDGSEGIRGSKLLFLEFIKFQDVFNLDSPSKLTVDYLTDLLRNNINRDKLYSILRVNILVDGDTLILPDNGIVYYDFNKDIFVHTYKYIDNSTSGNKSHIINEILSEVKKIIRESIDAPIVKYKTKVRLNSGTSNVSLSDNQKELGYLSPVIPDKTPEDGEDIETHNYYGYKYQESTDKAKHYDRTMILGDVLDFYNILAKTLTTQVSNRSANLTEKYSINRNHIPALVLLQHSENNAGIFLGSKNAGGLHEFSNIYNKQTALYFDVTVSNNNNDNVTRLILGKNKLVWNTDSLFTGVMQVENDIEITGNILNDNILTGNYAIDYSQYLQSLNLPSGDRRRAIQTIIGNNDTGANLLISSPNIKLDTRKFYSGGVGKSLVLTTDERGFIESKHSKDDSILTIPGSTFSNLTPIPGDENTLRNRIITAYHYNNLLSHLNLLFKSGVDGLYWKKSEWFTNIIPDLKLNNSLSVDNSVLFGNNGFNFNKTQDTISINTNTFNVTSNNPRFSKFTNKVLVTDGTGYIQNLYSIDRDFANIPLRPSSMSGSYPIGNELLTGTHFKYLNDILDTDVKNLRNNYWSKPEFHTGQIPQLWTRTRLASNQSLVIGSDASTNYSENFNTPSNPNINLFVTSGFSRLNSEYVWFDSQKIRFPKLPGNEENAMLAMTSLSNNKGYLKTIQPINELPENIPQILLTSNYYANGLTVKSLVQRITDLENKLTARIINEINNLSTQLQQIINQQLNPLINKVNGLEVKVNTNTTNINRIGIEDVPNQPGKVTIVSQHRTELNDLHHKTNVTNSNLSNLQNNFNVLKQQFEELKALFHSKINEHQNFINNTVQLPKGAIILWEGHIDGFSDGPINIPKGWEEVKSLRGRFPVGWSEKQKEFVKLFQDKTARDGDDYYWKRTSFDNRVVLNIEGIQTEYEKLVNLWNNFGLGGSKYLKLIEDQLPPHDHTFKEDGVYVPTENVNINPNSVTTHPNINSTNNAAKKIAKDMYKANSFVTYINADNWNSVNHYNSFNGAYLKSPIITHDSGDRKIDPNEYAVAMFQNAKNFESNGSYHPDFNRFKIQVVGQSRDINNLPPYKVVMFIRSINGITPERAII